MQRHMIEWEGKASEGIARVIAPQLQDPFTVEGGGGTTVEDILKVGCDWAVRRRISNLI